MNGVVRQKNGNIDAAGCESDPVSRCNGKELGKMIENCVPVEKTTVYKQTLSSKEVH